MNEVWVVPTGTANLASVLAALTRAGAETRVATSPSELSRARAILLPGVGSFGAALAKLEAEGFDEVIRAKIEEGIPALAICLGMQILFESSEESPGIRGLSILPGHLERFPDGVRVPHVGWNTVEPSNETRFLRQGDAYFTHSYRLIKSPNNAQAALTTYDAPFVSAVEWENILACQFHPELSGPWGLDLLRQWIRQEEAPC